MHVIMKTEDSSEESSTEIEKPDEIVIMLSFGHSWLSSSSWKDCGQADMPTFIVSLFW